MSVRTPSLDPIKYLVYKKYPHASALAQIAKEAPQFMPLLDPSPTLETHEWPTLPKDAEVYRRELASLPKNELNRLYQEEILKKKLEKDMQRFFNESYAKADFDHWSRAAYWTLEEALALSFGKDPEQVFWNRLEKIPYYESPFAMEYKKLRDLAGRALKCGKLYDPIIPCIFIGWMRQNEIDFPQELEEKAIARGNNIVNWKKMYDDLLEKNNNNVKTANKIIDAKNNEIINLSKSLDENKRQDQGKADTTCKPIGTRERETLLKMVIGMAIDAYGFEPAAPKSPFPKELQDILDRADLSVSNDTIRKYLNEAAVLLPRKTR